DGAYADIAVGPSGQVMVVLQDQSGGEGPTDLKYAVDADGLGSGGFAAAGKINSSNVGGFDYIPAEPNRSVDAQVGVAWDRTGKTHNGRVYFVYTDEVPDESNDMNIFVRFSDNNGSTWSNPVQVNDDTTTNSQYFPKIALDQTTGNIAVTFYDARNDNGSGGPGDTNGKANDDVQLWGTVSSDGGVTFFPNVQISVGTSNSNNAGN